MELREWLSRDENFSWLTEEELEILGSCFTLELQQLRPGERCESAGRLGYLLRGSGELQTDAETLSVKRGALLGTAPGGPRGHQSVRTTLTAAESCVVWWVSYDALEFACHRSCWFHTRLILKIQDMLEKEKKRNE